MWKAVFVTRSLVTEFRPRIRHWVEYTRSRKGSAGQCSATWTFILKTQLVCLMSRQCSSALNCAIQLLQNVTTITTMINHGKSHPGVLGTNIIYSSCNAGPQNKHNKDPRNSGTNTDLQSITCNRDLSCT